MEIYLHEFDPKTASESEWNKLHIYRKKYHDENTPGDPYFDDKSFETMIKTEMKNEEFFIRVYGILDLSVDNPNSQVIGIVFLQYHKENSPSYKGNEKISFFKIEIAKSFRRKGIATQILNLIVSFALEHEKTLLITSSEESDGQKFLKAINAQLALAMRENRLYLNTIDWLMVKDWIEEGERLNPGSKLVFFNKVDEKYIENYCEVFTFAGNQAPRDDLAIGDFVMTPKQYRKREDDFEAMGGIHEGAMIVEENGKISGLSELIFFKGTNNVLKQGLTAVLKEHRGRKLGKWLKAGLLLHIKEKYPTVEFISTGNAESNGPMLSINERLGFRKHKEMVNSQITLEKLQLYLKSKEFLTTQSYL
jgi:GNAT superfamily N-acetyltransferase